MADVKWLDPAPDAELMGNTLDLGREELTPLMERYGARRAWLGAAMLSPPTALIVAHRSEDETVLRDTLENEGWFVETCPGPAAGACPLLRGERCNLRGSADAAVVFIDHPKGAARSAQMPRLRCAADSSSPGVVVLEGRFDLPRFAGSTATVGALRGPEAIVEVVDALVSSGDAD